MLDWHGSGMSVMEMSHRSEEYTAIAEKAEQDLRDLMAIPSDYKVLFLQGGASQQFAEIPLNLLPEDGVADYIDTGIWSKKSIEEASRYGNINIAASAKASGNDVGLSGDKVTITIHASEGEFGHEAVPVGHNNVVYQIPRGKAWVVPKEVAQIVADAVVTSYKPAAGGQNTEMVTPRFAFSITPAPQAVAA